jgi:tetratricopeptide (TPR) repeat protein
VERAHGNSTGLACALVGLGWCAHDQGDFELAFELLEESLALGRKQGDTSSIAGACDALTVAAYQLGDFPQAIRWSEECLALFRAQGQVEPIGNVLAHLGSIAGYQGNMQQASHLLDEAMAMHQVHGSTLGVALTLRFQGQVARQCGDLVQAQTAYQDSLRLQRAMRGRWEITACLEGLAGVADGQGRPERAARLWGAAAKQRDQMGAPLPPAHRPDYDAAVAHARAALGAAVFDAVWAAGRALPLEHAIAEALAPSV